MLVTQLCPTLSEPKDYNLPGPSVHGILQARILNGLSFSSPGDIFPTQESNPGLLHCRQVLWTSLMAQTAKRLPTMWKTWVQSLGREDLLEKEMATHSSILAWKTPWMEEPRRLQSIGSQRVGHNWATSLSLSLPSEPPGKAYPSCLVSIKPGSHVEVGANYLAQGAPPEFHLLSHHSILVLLDESVLLISLPWMFWNQCI